MFSSLLTVLCQIVDLTRQLWAGVGGVAHRQCMPRDLQALVFARIERARIGLVRVLERLARGEAVAGGASVTRVSQDGVPRAVVPRAVVPRDGSARRVVVAQSLLSSRFGWLLWMAPGHTGTIRAFLLAALETPGVAAQIAADRQADRMVGSLCWMLGIRRAEIGHNARAAEARAVEAWTAPEAGRFSERDIDEAWGIVWARPVAGGVVLENSGVV